MDITSRDKRILSVIAILFAVRLLVINTIELAPDEAYYWYWSQHPSLAYSDHPPMVAWVMSLFTSIGGNSEFFVRLGGFLLSVAALFFLFDSARTLFPSLRNLPGEVLLAFNATLLFPAGCIIQTPDTPMLFFWAAAIWCGSRIAAGVQGPWWYLWGLFLGLGLLSKYTMVLLIPCMCGFLLFCPSRRSWLKRKEPWLALIIALVIFSPVLYWNWAHDWQSFSYQLRQGFSPKSEIAPLKILEYLGGQAGVVTPFLFVAFCWYSVKALQLSLKGERAAYVYLLFMSWPVLFFFGFSTAMGKVAEANWPAPSYIAGFILAAAVYHEAYSSRPAHRRFVAFGVCFAILAGLIVQAHLIKPFLPISPALDPVQQFYGWRDLGDRVSRIADRYPSAEGDFIVSDKGTTAAEVVFYSGARWTGLDFFQPERYAFLGDLSTLKGKDAILVLHGASDADLYRYSGYFERLERAGSYNNVFRGEKIDWLSVHFAIGRGFRGSWTAASGK